MRHKYFQKGPILTNSYRTIPNTMDGTWVFMAVSALAQQKRTRGKRSWCTPEWVLQGVSLWSRSGLMARPEYLLTLGMSHEGLFCCGPDGCGVEARQAGGPGRSSASGRARLGLNEKTGEGAPATCAPTCTNCVLRNTQKMGFYG